MTVDAATARELAERLAVAERSGTATALPSDTIPGFDWDDARRIALARDELRRADGDAMIGYKLGWTSAAMREALGIDRPNWGTLWTSQRLDGRLDLTTLRHAKLESEVVYVADRDTEGEDVTVDDALDAADGWALGIEVVRPRWPSFDFTWLDNTADNSSAAGVAIGPVGDLAVDPSEVDIVFSNDDESRTGVGALAMGSPAEAVAWLARRLATTGDTIAAGHIVFTGGLTPPFDAVGGARYTARSTHLEPVELVAGVDQKGAEPWPE